MRRVVFMMTVSTLLIIGATLGCATPQEYEKFRRIGNEDDSKDTFVLAREKCRWEAPPVPLVRMWIYRDCMAEGGWVADQ